MLEEWSAFSSQLITNRDLGEVMEHLGAKVDEASAAWRLERGDHYLLVIAAHEDIEDLDDDLLDPIRELMGHPESRIALLFDIAKNKGDFEARMARAVAIALAERYPIVLDDHAGQVERIAPLRHS